MKEVITNPELCEIKKSLKKDCSLSKVAGQVAFVALAILATISVFFAPVTSIAALVLSGALCTALIAGSVFMHDLAVVASNQAKLLSSEIPDRRILDSVDNFFEYLGAHRWMPSYFREKCVMMIFPPYRFVVREQPVIAD